MHEGVEGMADKARSGAGARRCAGVSVGDPGESIVTRNKTTAAARTHQATGARLDPASLPVRPGEDAWTAEEVLELQTELDAEAAELRAEITTSEEAVSGLMRDSGDGAGDDQVDAGTKNISREHELSLAANARDMLAQTERALLRIASSSFGLCESCGKAIGKARVQAFPRATLCVECKQKQERRY
ncbi:TraR/DksA family transcriptional regulator [Streptacidiphilus sp. NEAU-YB345]|uniref:TraR/DksA family transcriptional regulator n=1 Tax=Streptacidiphilus fuscans TaxID=2789292 RepID=A0A931B7N2_9ACTN|nr:TraR/DksA family transcriptional regulator [Streptacidiphilus fuscans]